MKKKIFSKGYNEVRQRVRKGGKFIQSCYNCEFYYQAPGDDEEMCQNQEVLRYDMTVSETNICCNRWELTHRNVTVKSIFKKEIEK